MPLGGPVFAVVLGLLQLSFVCGNDWDLAEMYEADFSSYMNKFSANDGDDELDEDDDDYYHDGALADDFQVEFQGKNGEWGVVEDLDNEDDVEYAVEVHDSDSVSTFDQESRDEDFFSVYDEDEDEYEHEWLITRLLNKRRYENAQKAREKLKRKQEEEEEAKAAAKSREKAPEKEPENEEPPVSIQWGAEERLVDWVTPPPKTEVPESVPESRWADTESLDGEADEDDAPRTFGQRGKGVRRILTRKGHKAGGGTVEVIIVRRRRRCTDVDQAEGRCERSQEETVPQAVLRRLYARATRRAAVRRRAARMAASVGPCLETISEEGGEHSKRGGVVDTAELLRRARQPRAATEAAFGPCPKASPKAKRIVRRKGVHVSEAELGHGPRRALPLLRPLPQPQAARPAEDDAGVAGEVDAGLAEGEQARPQARRRIRVRRIPKAMDAAEAAGEPEVNAV